MGDNNIRSKDGQLVKVGPDRLTVPQFLRRVAAHLEGEGEAADSDLAWLAPALLGGGLPAVRAQAREETWVQLAFTPPDGNEPTPLYRVLADAARGLLSGGDVGDFFFVNKPPGVRARFRTLPDHREQVEARMQELAQVWRRDGLIAGWRPAVYEPEQHLFGGPASMRSVHRVFTADSLVWLDAHGAQPPVGPTWVLSLLLIRALFAEMGVDGWENRDVWDRLRRQAGRHFEGGEPEGWPRAAAALRAAWKDPDRLWSKLAPTAGPMVARFQEAVKGEFPHWDRAYFSMPTAYVGPREAAAFLIVFHWNRARMPFSRQCAITEALWSAPTALS
ncbi:thiopeptide-type bacteriocin biosynthesis protein [Kitasatospora aureofaciens]|uniref:thiopeptide-type bacteriocin biosynthesis protein n=1 Tax=Kitasatospora aureofaciens TaxID=1894 RepID=UPI001C4594C4|nr:thiopeptide-type bacteriocin biosynthesis protein [Kitasatospora aureofaciens]MBV6695662.1 thiopeptide-type bacteriocin biosynthesis protein [Kitasatospora aureofaciens]